VCRTAPDSHFFKSFTTLSIQTFGNLMPNVSVSHCQSTMVAPPSATMAQKMGLAGAWASQVMVRATIY